MKRTIAYTAAALFAAALVTAPSAAAGPEEDLLVELAGAGLLSAAPDEVGSVISGARSVCAEYGAGATYAGQVARLRGMMGWSDSQVGTYVATATRVLCPEYAPLIG